MQKNNLDREDVMGNMYYVPSTGISIIFAAMFASTMESMQAQMYANSPCFKKLKHTKIVLFLYFTSETRVNILTEIFP